MRTSARARYAGYRFPTEIIGRLLLRVVSDLNPQGVTDEGIVSEQDSTAAPQSMRDRVKRRERSK
jgi:hypothetical protein